VKQLKGVSRKLRAAAVALALCVIVPALAASAATVNSSVTAWPDTFYIPLTPSHSGILGDDMGDFIVGSEPDKVMVPAGGSTSGSIQFIIPFQIRGNADGDIIADDQVIDMNPETGGSPIVLFTRDDLDFEIQEILANLTYWETLAFQFLDPEMQPLTDDYGYETCNLTLNQYNYGSYYSGPLGGAAQYEIDLAATGMTQDHANAISGPGQDYIYMLMTLTSDLVNDRKAGQIMLNTEEDLSATLIFEVTPEPGSLALLVLGGSALLRRRRLKRAVR